MNDSWIERRPDWLRDRRRVRRRPAGESEVQGSESKEQNQEKDVKEAAVEEPMNGVVFRPVRCPACESKNHRIYKTDLPVRYHQCLDCGKRFKSIEE